MKVSNYQPFGDQILVEDPVVLEQRKRKKNTNQIIVTDEVLREQLKAEQGTIFVTVLGIGDQVTMVKKGDKILFNGLSSVIQLEEDDGVSCEFLQIKEYQILGKAISQKDFDKKVADFTN